MPNDLAADLRLRDPAKFQDPEVTAKGEKRAVVALTHLQTVWFNTGSLCNLSCQGCYMESGPTNDRLVFLGAAEVRSYLDEIEAHDLPVEEIGFTGGEPFMNEQFPAILEEALSRGFKVLVLTNAMRPIERRREVLRSLNAAYGEKMTLRVSIDHYMSSKHEITRGKGTWDVLLANVKWLAENGISLTVAGRTCWDEDEETMRKGYAARFTDLGIPVDATDPRHLVLFPEMDERKDVPEITTACWDIVGARPEAMMCATSRMVIKRKGAEHPVVVPCTLLPYDARFELGCGLRTSAGSVPLNHPHCATFCVLGGAACGLW